MIIAESEDAEWIDEDDVDTTAMEMPPSVRPSGLPVVDDNEQLPWE